MKRFVSLKRWGLGVGGFLLAISVAFARDVGYYLQVKSYLHTPEAFDDRYLGAIPTDRQIPIGVPNQSIWYVKYVGHFSFANLAELFSIVGDRQSTATDRTGHTDISD